MSYSTSKKILHGLTASLLAAGLWTDSAAAAPINVALANLQPVDQESIIETPYDPTHPDAEILLEEVHLDESSIPYYRTSIDFEVVNNGTEYIRLDKLLAHYPGSGYSSLQVFDDDLLGYDASLYETPPSNTDKKRSAISAGGFGVTGAVIQQSLGDEPFLPYGRARAALAYKPPGSDELYAVAGDAEYLIGDPMAFPTLSSQSFLAIYNSAGSLVTSVLLAGDRIADIADLGDGRFLAAADNIGPSLERTLSLQRLQLYEVDAEGNAQDTNLIIPEVGFGTDGLAQASFSVDGVTCEDVVAVGVTPVRYGLGPTRYLAAAAVRCGGAPRAGLAMFDQDGLPYLAFGGQGTGTQVLAGPGGAALRPVGVERRKGFTIGRFGAWLAAGVGECGFGETGCEFGITRVDYSGMVEGFGWQTTTFPEAESAVPYGMDVDKTGRVLVGGTSHGEWQRYAALARFTNGGSLDATFGSNGLAVTAIGAEDTDIVGVAATQDGGVAAAAHIEDGGGISSLGVIRFESNGNILYTHDTRAEPPVWKYTPLEENLNYGSYLESVPLSGFAFGVAADSADRVLVVGGVHGNIETPPWGGPEKIALVRYLPNGEPDSRRWVAPGDKLKIALPEDRTFAYPQPTVISIELDFLGGTLVDMQFDRPLRDSWHHSVISNPMIGSYHFPFANEDLAFNEAATVSGHVLTHHHRHSPQSRFAYDIGLGYWNGAFWTGLVEGALDGGDNENHRAWNLPVRAMADGEIIACRRTSSDNEPGDISGAPANFVTIQHSFDAFDKQEREYMDYLHLRQDSIPEELCPNICPEDDPECNPLLDGVDPDGRTLPEPIPVTEGQMIGRVGNSGISTGPHLHIQLRTGAGGDPGDPFAGGVPILFSNTLLGERFNAMGDEQNPVIWYPVEREGLPHRYLVVPVGD